METTETDLIRELLETLTAAKHEAFWVVELSGGAREVLYASPGADGLWGAIHADDAHLVEASLEEALCRVASEVEYRVAERGGEPRRRRARHVLLTPPGTEPARVLGVTSECGVRPAPDLTPFTTALNTAEEAGASLRALLVQLSESVAIIDVAGEIEFANPTLMQALGYADPEDAPDNAFELVHPEDLERAHAALTRALSTADGREEVSVRVRHRTAGWRHVQVLVSNLLAHPSVHGVVLNLFDHTEHLHVERALRETAGRFRSILEAASDLITLIDREARITYQSPSSQRILGYGPAELLGREARGLVHPDDEPRFRASFRRMLLQPGEVIEGEPIRLRRRDGGYITIEYAGRNLLEDPGVGAILMTGRDVTERVRAAEELRRSQEQLRFSQRMEAVGRLAGGVAHDFNNILTVVQGHLDLLLADPPRDPQDLAAQLEEARSAAERATRLTRQLLAFSRQQVLRSELVSVDDVILGIEPLLRRALSERIELGFQFGSGGASVLADRGQLEQVILNLALNARDAMPHGGTLTVRSRLMDVRDENELRTGFEIPPGRYTCLEVEDTGTGIPAEVLPNIFEPFFTTKEQGRGTGLGLSTVYGIMKQSGGFIWAVSDGRTGACFKLLLPLAEGGAHGQRKRTEARAEGEAELGTVLVVEDDDSVRGLVDRFLRSGGMEVVSVPTAAHALELLEAGHPVDVVLTDIVMPHMSGLELNRHIRQTWPHLPVVLMSGYTEEYQLGENGLPEDAVFLEKPFSRADLIAAVQRARR